MSRRKLVEWLVFPLLLFFSSPGAAQNNSEVPTVLSWMNPTADPCTHFRDYSCGGFYEMVRRKNVDSWGELDVVEEMNRRIYEDILNKPKHSSDAPYTKQMKDAYAACRHVVAREKNGWNDVLTSSIVLQWPSVTAGLWKPRPVDPLDIISLARENFIELLFRKEIKWEYGARKIELHLETDLLAESLTDISHGSSKVHALSHYYANLAETLGSDRYTAECDAKDVERLVIALVTIKRTLPFEKKWSATLGELQAEHPRLNLRRLIESSVAGLKEKVPDDTIVEGFGYSRVYFDLLPLVLEWTSPMVVHNLVGFEFARQIMHNMSPRMIQIENKFNKAVGRSLAEGDWSNEDCIDYIVKYFEKPLGREYTDRIVHAYDRDWVEEYFLAAKEQIQTFLIGGLQRPSAHESKMFDWIVLPTKEDMRGSSFPLVGEKRLRQPNEEELKKLDEYLRAANEQIETFPTGGGRRSKSHSAKQFKKLEEITLEFGLPRANYSAHFVTTLYKHLEIRPQNHMANLMGVRKLIKTRERRRAWNNRFEEKSPLVPEVKYRPEENSVYVSSAALQELYGYENTSAILSGKFVFKLIRELVKPYLPQSYELYFLGKDYRSSIVVWTWGVIYNRHTLNSWRRYFSKEGAGQLLPFGNFQENLAVVESFIMSDRQFHALPKNYTQAQVPGTNLTMEQLFYISYAQNFCSVSNAREKEEMEKRGQTGDELRMMLPLKYTIAGYNAGNAFGCDNARSQFATSQYRALHSGLLGEGDE